MDFDFSPDQQALRADVSRLLSRHADGMRRSIDAGSPFDLQTWQALRDFGASGIGIPEPQGGVGLGYLELCVVYEELGRALVAAPFSASKALFGEFLRTTAEGVVPDSILTEFASGALIGAFAFAETSGACPTSSPTASVRDSRLTGRKVAVINGAVAGAAIVTARDEKDVASIYLVDLTQQGVTRRNTKAIDPSFAVASIEFNEAVVLAKLNNAEGIASAVNRAAVLLSFEQVGGAEASLAMARDYALTRTAFGRSIGSFQAIKHMLADMYVSAALAKSNAYYAAWALSTGSPELPRAAAAARLSATTAYQHCARNNIQIHGGMGFTWESDCHLHYRRANALAVALGPSRHWENILVDMIDPRAA